MPMVTKELTLLPKYLHITKWFKVKEVAPGVFTFMMFQRPERNLLNALVDEEKDTGAPNSMNKYGKVLGGRGWNDWVSATIQNTLQPLARHAFDGMKLKRRAHAMTVEYDVKKQKSLASHVDSSDLTLNVCLDGKFTGGDLMVYSNDGRASVRIKQKPGLAIVHTGDTLHRATKLKTGTRRNLVIWCEQKK